MYVMCKVSTCMYLFLSMEHQGVHKNLFRNTHVLQDWIGIWKLEIFEGREKSRVPGENLLEQSWETIIKSLHIHVHVWCWVQQSNQGHIGGRRALSALCHPYSPKMLLIINYAIKQSHCLLLVLVNGSFYDKHFKLLISTVLSIFLIVLLYYLMKLGYFAHDL